MATTELHRSKVITANLFDAHGVPTVYNNLRISGKLKEWANNGDGAKRWAPQQVIWDVISKVMHKHPTWVFEFTDCYLVAGVALSLLDFVVYTADGIELGRLDVVVRKGEYSMALTNDRIDKRLKKYRAVYSRDPQVVVRSILRDFVAPSLHEVMSAVRKHVVNAEYELTNNVSASWSRAMYNLFNEAHDFVQAHMHEYVKAHNKLQEFDRYQAATVRRDLHAYFANTDTPKALVVVRSEAEYVVATDDGTEVMSADKLPPHIAARVGLLKLVDNGGFVPAAGLKVDDNVFRVLAAPELPSDVLSLLERLQ